METLRRSTHPIPNGTFLWLATATIGLCGGALLSGCSSEDLANSTGVGGSGVSATSNGTNSAGNASASGGGASTGVDGTSVSGGTSGSSTSGGTSSGSTSTTSGGTSSSSTSTEVCARWNEDRADMSESAWTGAVSGCTAGDMDATSRANALRLVNLYRWLAGQPAVTLNDTYNAAEQQCALMMEGHDGIDHAPDNSWACYSQTGDDAAGRSNLATCGAVEAVDGYMIDFGNGDTLGHRRWILGSAMGATGFGSTGNFSCMWTFDDSGTSTAEWTAWPPPGQFPIAAASYDWGGGVFKMDTEGWSVHSKTINFSAASVTVTLNGASLPVTTLVLPNNYGDKYAMSFVPDGWSTTAGSTYHVEITGITPTISYDVTVVTCE